MRQIQIKVDLAIEEYSKHNNKRQKKKNLQKIEETSYSYKSKIYDTNEKETGYSYKSKIYEINDNDKSNSNEKNENFGNSCFQRYRNSKKNNQETDNKDDNEKKNEGNDENEKSNFQKLSNTNDTLNKQ